MSLGPYATCHVLHYEDDQKSDFWYFFLIEKRNTVFPGLYVNFHGQLSANCLLDPALSTLDVQAMFTCNTQTGDITCHFVGHGKLHLPGIANSSAMKYGINEVESSVAQFVQRSAPSACPVIGTLKLNGQTIAKITGEPSFKVLPRTSRCDCGGKKLGYEDNQPWGHGSWCKVHEKEETSGN